MLTEPRRGVRGSPFADGFVKVHIRTLVVAALGLALALALPDAFAAEDAATKSAQSVALLDVKLINDNEGLDPTSDAERARLVKLEEQVTSALEGSGKYKIVRVTDDIKAAIAKGQPIGECGGCDIEFGKQLGVDLVAWVTVQKISNLILNMNFYLADVATNKMAFLKSVDIRGNTDETWARSMKYLLNNYLLVDEPPSGAVAPKTP